MTVHSIQAGSEGNILFGNVLRTLRETCHKSKDEVTGEAGISRPFIDGIERGAQAPSMETAKKLLSIVTNDRFQVIWAHNGPYDLMIHDFMSGQQWEFMFKAEIRGQNRRPDRESGIELTGHFNLGPMVDGSCPNENCSEYMIAVQYIATMEYVNRQNVVSPYFDLAMRCGTCGSLYPRANESQLQEQEKTSQTKINDFEDDPVTLLLYQLAMDDVAIGILDDLINNYIPGAKTNFRNKQVGEWAREGARKLRGETIVDDPKEGLPMKDSVRGPG